MDGAGTQIVGGQEPVRSHLALNAQVPLIHIGRVEIVQWRINVGSASYKGNIWSLVTEAAARGQEGQRILPRRQQSTRAARIISPRIRQVRTCHADLIPKRRAELLLAQRQHAHTITEHSITGANGHLAVAFGIERQAYTREELVPLGTVEGV